MLFANAAPAFAEEAENTDYETAPAGEADQSEEAADTQVEWHGQIVVYGRGEKRIGEAGAASEGGVAGADIEIRPLLRPAELLEATPGLIATQHSGGGKANQYFLRGFNLDHGTDFGLYIDDMPINFRTHGHGQGYLDVNGLIPETVERVDYRKGPYRASTGDFSFVGSSFITTRTRWRPLPRSRPAATAIAASWRADRPRSAAATCCWSARSSSTTARGTCPRTTRAGPGLLKYSVPLGDGRAAASALNGFKATWAPTEQLPERAVGTLVRRPLRLARPTLRGRTERETLTINYEDDDWKITGWAQHYDWSLLSNFTFFLDDPVNGDQLRQYEKLWGFGGRLERNFKLSDTLHAAGSAPRLRRDSIDPVGPRSHDRRRVRFRDAPPSRSMRPAAASMPKRVWQPVDRLMVIGGVRGDFYRFKTEDLGGVVGWRAQSRTSIFSPKIGVNYEIPRRHRALRQLRRGLPFQRRTRR